MILYICEIKVLVSRKLKIISRAKVCLITYYKNTAARVLKIVLTNYLINYDPFILVLSMMNIVRMLKIVI